MAETKIEWTDFTWNPVLGCTRAGAECRNCYAEIMAARFSDLGQWGHGIAKRVKLPGGGTDHRWTGEVRFVDHMLDRPLRWKKQRRIFVCSTSDLFHPSVPDEWIDKVFAVMALCPQHTFQVLTKRPERMRKYLSDANNRLKAAAIATRMHATGRWTFTDEISLLWPLPNVWLGTSIADQATADERIPHLRDTPAAVRFISAEPLLGLTIPDLTGIDWVIVGGESGPGARPMHPAWPRSLRDQCIAAGVAYFFKQWGEWLPGEGDGNAPARWQDGHQGGREDSREWRHFAEPGTPGAFTIRVGKKAAGRLLDGRTWDQMPGVAA
jgi:protein gp37